MAKRESIGKTPKEQPKKRLSKQAEKDSKKPLKQTQLTLQNSTSSLKRGQSVPSAKEESKQESKPQNKKSPLPLKKQKSKSQKQKNKIIDTSPKKGQRGKKLCPACNELMPIHCQFCKNCNHEFHMNHKPKKIKEYIPSETLFNLVSTRDNSLILSKCKYFGNSGKNPKRERLALPEAQPVHPQQLPRLAKSNSSRNGSLPPQPVLQEWSTNDVKVQLMNQCYIKRSVQGDIPGCIFVELLLKMRPVIQELESCEKPLQDNWNIRFNGQQMESMKGGMAGQVNYVKSNEEHLSFINFGSESKIIKYQWIIHCLKEIGKLLVVGVKQGADQNYLFIYECQSVTQIHLLYKVKIDCKELTDFDLIQSYTLKKDIITSAALVQDGKLSIINLPLLKNQSTISIKPAKQFDLEHLNLVRWMPFGENNLIAVTDFLSNVFIFEDGVLNKTNH